jgi:hypothetical protein
MLGGVQAVTFCQTFALPRLLFILEDALAGQNMAIQKPTQEAQFCIPTDTQQKKEHDLVAWLVRTKSNAKHTAAGIPTWSPTVVLICRSTAYVWQSGRDAQFSADCGRMCLSCYFSII